jgi:hypothetical protein
MTKIKTLSTTALLFLAVAAPVLAEEGGALDSRKRLEPISSADREKADTISRMREREATEPGDFAVTGGESDTSRAWNPTDQVAPGTSNAPCGTCGGE